MKITDMNWMQVEQKVLSDGRAVVPMGSTEQHAYLRLAVDAILAERVASEAAEPLGVPVFPVLNYGITPYFLRYPGSISIRLDTYQRIVTDILDSLAGTGFKRVMFVNGHGGNIAGRIDAAGVDERPSGSDREVAQLVERAEDRRRRGSYRSRRVAWIMDGELSLDASGRAEAAGWPEANDRYLEHAHDGRRRRAGIPGRRQFRRRLPEG